MHRLTQKLTAKLRLVVRIRALRSDQRGSLSLAAGMMAFLATMFAFIGFDTNMAIYNRIVAQNAVDSAAESAALWQARGCNMLQQLNNLHYDVNMAACIAEGVDLTACFLADGAMVAQLAAEASLFFAELAPVFAAARYVACTVCDTLPYVDYYQNVFYNLVLDAQKVITDVTPILAAANANACAQGSGADKLLGSVLGAVQGVLSQVGIDTSGIGDLSGIGGGVLGSIPIYAAPLTTDPVGMLSLHTDPKDNDGSVPWSFPEAVGVAGQVEGYVGCSQESAIATPMPPSVLIGPPFTGYFDDADQFHSNNQKSGPNNQTWGWNDQYYFGNPGFMTWVAGKEKKDDPLHLGNLRWLNGGLVSNDQPTNAEDVSRVMYTGENTSTAVLEIPAFVAFASSQVEGTPVISHGDVDAAGKLITVHLSDGSTTDSMWIFH
jgi:hypothetical protein